MTALLKRWIRAPGKSTQEPPTLKEIRSEEFQKEVERQRNVAADLLRDVTNGKRPTVEEMDLLSEFYHSFRVFEALLTAISARLDRIEKHIFDDARDV